MAFFGRVNQLVRGLVTAAMIQQKKGKRIGNQKFSIFACVASIEKIAHTSWVQAKKCL